MNVFGTPLRVMDHGQVPTSGMLTVTNTSISWQASPSIPSDMPPQVGQGGCRSGCQGGSYQQLFASEPQIELASKLVKLAGAPEGSKVYFGNSGAEGNEAALKLAKLYGRTLPGALPSIGGKPHAFSQ